MTSQVAFLGFGEVGVTLADDLAGRGVTLAAWDRQFTNNQSTPFLAADSRRVRLATSGLDAVGRADVVISAVTAAETVNAARDCAAAVATGAFFLDLNSASPGAKARAASAINDAGGRYVEAAVMSPIQPRRAGSPMLVCGPHAEAFLPVAAGLGFSSVTAVSPDYGVAAATKLCRSIIVKGIEALLVEAMLTGRHYGVEGGVLASLRDLFPGLDWPCLSRYMIARAIEHGKRRAEEMREAAATVEGAGVEAILSRAIAARQDWSADFRESLGQQELGDLLDAMASELSARQPEARDDAGNPPEHSLPYEGEMNGS